MADVWPERADFYQGLLEGRHEPDGYQLVRRFMYPTRWWLSPTPEFASPDLVVFTKPEVMADVARAQSDRGR
jgi:hypothetical protein